jgi:uncharacterized protein (DUF2267 family)
MAVKGLEGIDETVQETYVWINEVADAFHGDRHGAFRIIRAYLALIRDHLSVDEAAQLSAQLPMLLRGAFFEGWDPSRDRQHDRSAVEFLSNFVARSGVRPMDARAAVAAAAGVLRHHVSAGEMEDVLGELPKQLRVLMN